MAFSDFLEYTVHYFFAQLAQLSQLSIIFLILYLIRSLLYMEIRLLFSHLVQMPFLAGDFKFIGFEFPIVFIWLG